MPPQETFTLLPPFFHSEVASWQVSSSSLATLSHLFLIYLSLFYSWTLLSSFALRSPYLRPHLFAFYIYILPNRALAPTFPILSPPFTSRSLHHSLISGSACPLASLPDAIFRRSHFIFTSYMTQLLFALHCYFYPERCIIYVAIWHHWSSPASSY